MNKICHNCIYHNFDTDSNGDNYEKDYCYCELNREEHAESECEIYKEGKETDCHYFEYDGEE